MFSLEVLLQTPNSTSVSGENGKSLALLVLVVVVAVVVNGAVTIIPIFYLYTANESKYRSGAPSKVHGRVRLRRVDHTLQLRLRARSIPALGHSGAEAKEEVLEDQADGHPEVRQGPR